MNVPFGTALGTNLTLLLIYRLIMNFVVTRLSSLKVSHGRSNNPNNQEWPLYRDGAG
jgi:hypothetical protein